MMSNPESLRTIGFSKVTPPQCKPTPPRRKVAKPVFEGLYQPSHHSPEKSSPIMWPAIIFSQKTVAAREDATLRFPLYEGPTKPRSRRQKLLKKTPSASWHLKIGLNAPNGNENRIPTVHFHIFRCFCC